MKYFSFLISFFITISTFGQVDSLKDKIEVCNGRICEMVKVGKTKIKAIRLVEKTETYEDLFEKNFQNCKTHNIKKERFVKAFPMEKTKFDKLTKRAQKDLVYDILIQESEAYKEVNGLIKLLELDKGDNDKQRVQKNIEQLNDYQGVSFLLDGFDNFLMKKIKARQDGPYDSSDFIFGLRENRKIITDHLAYLIDRDFLMYSQTSSKQKLIKGSSFYHDNDVFMPLLNEDKYYTGGGRYEIYTDYLRLNFLHNLITKDYGVLSYQGVFFGAEAFTPYIRYKHIDTLTRANYYNNDRPFASYEYGGLAHYRLDFNGQKRSKIQFRLGRIGGERSEKVQSILHRDQTIKSVKVLGWENQIANGGRLAFNLDYKRDWMLFSNGKGILDKNKENPKFQNAHLHSFLGLNLGNYLTAAEVGLGVSSLSFNDRDGNENFKLELGQKTQCHFYANASLQYVIHNTSLEGFGIYNTHDDDDSETTIPKSKYVIAKEDVNRWVGLIEAGFGIRTNRTTLFYKLTLKTKEFNKGDFLYGWGTIGLTFNSL